MKGLKSNKRRSIHAWPKRVSALCLTLSMLVSLGFDGITVKAEEVVPQEAVSQETAIPEETTQETVTQDGETPNEDAQTDSTAEQQDLSGQELMPIQSEIEQEEDDASDAIVATDSGDGGEIIGYVYGGIPVKQYNSRTSGGHLIIADDGDIRFILANGQMAVNCYLYDDDYTYYLGYNGAPYKNTTAYSVDGHMIYFDAFARQVRNNFVYCEDSGIVAYFDENGYAYLDQTLSWNGREYYLNAYGQLEQHGWFWYANGQDLGFANWDGTLVTDCFSYDMWGRTVYFQSNGKLARGLITDGAWYYNMDPVDGHLLGKFEVAATNRSNGMAKSKKGMQGTEGVLSDTDLGISHSLLNLYLSQWISDEPTDCYYDYCGTRYYFKNHTAVDDYVKKANAMGITVSFVLLMPWDETHQDMIYPGARDGGAHDFYELDPFSPRVWALFHYMAQHYSKSDCHVDNWILGNEVNMPNTYNYTGTLDLTTNTYNYAGTMNILSTALQTYNPNARAYISLDHSWTHNDEGRGIAGKSYLVSFGQMMQAINPNAKWNVAYHLYTPIMTSSRMWLKKYRRYTPDNENAQFISAVNLDVLTNFVMNHYGMNTRVILSEQGFDCKEGTQYQAAALAYTFYAAEFNNMVDAVIFRSYQTDPNDGIFDLGLKDSNGNPREAYDVFKYMDTPNGNSYTDRYLPVIGVQNWTDLVPGYYTVTNWQ